MAPDWTSTKIIKPHPGAAQLRVYLHMLDVEQIASKLIKSLSFAAYRFSDRNSTASNQSTLCRQLPIKDVINQTPLCRQIGWSNLSKFVQTVRGPSQCQFVKIELKASVVAGIECTRIFLVDRRYARQRASTSAKNKPLKTSQVTVCFDFEKSPRTVLEIRKRC